MYSFDRLKATDLRRCFQSLFWGPIMRVVFSPFIVVGTNKLRFAAFLLVNCFFGSFGILAPLAVSGYTTGPAQGFWKIFNDGNGFTFAIALLATASSFLISDAISAKKTGFKSFRIGAALTATFWLVCLCVWAAIHFSIPIEQKSFPCSSAAILQITATLGTVGFAIWLFCVDRMDDHEDAEVFDSFRDRNKKKLLQPPMNMKV